MRDGSFTCGIGETRPFWAVLARRWWRNTRIVELRSWTLLREAVAEQPGLPLLIDARWLREPSQRARLVELQREFPESLLLAGVLAYDLALVPDLYVSGIQQVVRVTDSLRRLEQIFSHHERNCVRAKEPSGNHEEGAFDVGRLLARLPWPQVGSR